MKKMPSALTCCLFYCIFATTGGWIQAGEIDPQHGTNDPDGKTVWYDSVLFSLAGKGWTNTESFYDRLPATAKTAVPKDVWDLSHDTTGMYLQFSTDATTLEVRWALVRNDLGLPHMPSTGVSGVDLYVKDKQGAWVFHANGRPRYVTKNKAHFSVSPGATYRLYLPLFNGIKSMALGIPKNNRFTTPGPADAPPRKPIVFYGTSITQGGCASRPGMAATAIVSRRLDWPIINLGFSGSGRMEPALADLLSELDPALYVLDCLANMTPNMVTDRVEPFVKILRKAHPTTPILLVEESNFEHLSPTEKGTLLQTIQTKLVKEGDTHLHFLSNEGMLGNDYEGTVDGLHPNDLGMMRQADVFIKTLPALLSSPLQNGITP